MPSGIKPFLLVEKTHENNKTEKEWDFFKFIFYFFEAHAEVSRGSVSVCLFWLLEKAYLMSEEENPNKLFFSPQVSVKPGIKDWDLQVVVVLTFRASIFGA